MATHSSILAWRIPWTKEPGGLLVHGIEKSQTRLSSHTHCYLEQLSIKNKKNRFFFFMAVSFQCMTKFTTKKNRIKKKRKIDFFNFIYAFNDFFPSSIVWIWVSDLCRFLSLKNFLKQFLLGRSTSDKFPQFLFIWESISPSLLKDNFIECFLDSFFFSFHH